MAAKPTLLLYDEATTGLDPMTALTVDAEIVKVRDLEQATSVLVTHQLRDAFYVATHQARRAAGGDIQLVEAGKQKVDEADFVMIREGRVYFEGTASELRDSTGSVLAKVSFVKGQDTMPRTRSLAWAELKFGIIAVFALVMAGLLIFAVGGSGGFFWQNYPLKVRFPNVAGLMSGSPVRVAGVEVGSVTNVELVPGGAEVWFNIVDDMKPIVTDRSTAKIGSISLLGEGAVDIEAGPGGTPIPDWGYVPTGKAGADDRRADRAGRRGHRRRDGDLRRPARRQGHRRQAPDR